MAIHTQQGVTVRIIRKLDNEKVVVQDIDFPTWVREYDIWRLRADGGLEEIEAAVEDAPAEHLGSRALDEDLVREAPHEPIDRMFKEAADAGFKPITEEQAASFREKLRDFSAVLHGGRR